MKTVLVTNAQQRKTLSAARSLGKRGVRVIAAEETRLNPTAFSKHCSKSLVYPNPQKHPEGFYLWLKKTITRYECDIVFPMDDDTLSVIMQHYKELSKLCEIPLPVEGYKTASDKKEQVLLAIKSGVDCPLSIFPESMEELEKTAESLVYPVVIKPRKSSGSRGITVVKTPGELLSKYKELNEKYPWPIIQDCIGLGDRYDVCLLYDRKHELKACFVQREIRHFPIPMGPSTMQESVEYPELVQAALRMADKLNWYGVIEFEFMVDSRDGKPKFMEINPRFWASVEMAAISGMDFPWLLYRTVTEEDIPAAFTYRTGLRCRWLLPGEIFHYITNKDRKNMDPPFCLAGKKGIHDDILSAEDPLPFVGFLLACIRYLFSPAMWRFMFKR